MCFLLPIRASFTDLILSFFFSSGVAVGAFNWELLRLFKTLPGSELDSVENLRSSSRPALDDSACRPKCMRYVEIMALLSAALAPKPHAMAIDGFHCYNLFWFLHIKWVSALNFHQAGSYFETSPEICSSISHFHWINVWAAPLKIWSDLPFFSVGCYSGLEKHLVGNVPVFLMPRLWNLIVVLSYKIFYYVVPQNSILRRLLRDRPVENVSVFLTLSLWYAINL